MRKSWILLLTLLFCVSSSACAEFVNPTRDPAAPEYDMNQPASLTQEQLVAHSFVLMNRESGEILLQRNAGEAMFPASTTAIWTAYLAVRYGGDPLDTVIVSDKAVDLPPDASRVPFLTGEEVTLKSALFGLLLKGGSDAANAIAEHVSGDIAAFVRLMNEEAHAIGCTNTQFTNPHGYHDNAHYTSALDLAKMMDVALDQPILREILSSASYAMPATALHPARTIQTTNVLIDTEHERYTPYVVGGKTGFDPQAGYTQVMAAERDGQALIVSVMHSGTYSRWPDVIRLFEYGFAVLDE